MADAYRIGVSIALSGTAEISSALGLISRDFAKANVEAKALQETLRNVKLIGFAGAITAGGVIGLDMFKSLAHAGGEYAHQLNIVNMAINSHGERQADVAAMVAAAWKNTGDVITTSATGNLKTLLDMNSVLGDTKLAIKELPMISRIQAVMQSSSESGVNKVASDNFAFTMSKALDIVGAAKDPTGADFERQAEKMSRAITATQGRMTPAMYQSIFAYARQAKFSMDDEFKYEILPTLGLEYAQGTGGAGGGSRGVGPGLAALNRLTVQGYTNKLAIPDLEKLGLIPSGMAHKTKKERDTELYETNVGGKITIHSKPLATTTTSTMVPAWKGFDGKNPFRSVQDSLLPAINKLYGGVANDEQITKIIQSIGRGNQMAAQDLLEFALKAQNFYRLQKIIHQDTMGSQEAYTRAMQNDPKFAYMALGKQWENLKTAFGIAVIPIIIPAISGLTDALNSFAKWAIGNPETVKGIMAAVGALTALALVAGPLLLLRAAFMLFAPAISIMAPIAAGLTGIGGGLGAITGVAGIGALGATLGTIAAGFGILTGVTTALAWAIGALDKDTDPLNHPGMHRVRRHGQPDSWEKDESLSQEHAGMHFQRYGRGGSWMPDMAKSPTAPNPTGTNPHAGQHFVGRGSTGKWTPDFPQLAIPKAPISTPAPGSQTFSAPPKKDINITANLNVDGKKMTSIMFKHAADGMNGPTSTLGAFDANQSFFSPAMPGASLY